MPENNITIYTDGSCLNNPGCGGWGALIVETNKETEIYGGEPNTTNNRMELTAAIKALEYCQDHKLITLYTDSIYLKNGISKWIHNWILNNWRGSSGPVKNQDLWKKLYDLDKNKQIKWKWVKGHNKNRGNEIAHQQASKGALMCKKNSI